MPLLSLPEDLQLYVLLEWVGAGMRPGWKALSALDVAACGGLCRASVMKLLSRVAMELSSDTDAFFASMGRYCVPFVTWIETRRVLLSAPLLLTFDDIIALNAHPKPVFQFLRGIVIRDLYVGTLFEQCRELLGRIPNLAHFGVEDAFAFPGDCRLVLDTVLHRCGLNLRSLYVPCAVEEALVTGISANCPQLQDLVMHVGANVDFCVVSDLLERRGGLLRTCIISCAGRATPHWGAEAVLRDALQALTHPALQRVGIIWDINGDHFADVFLEFLATHPRLRSCNIGGHHFEGGTLTLPIANGAGMQRTLVALAGMRDLAVTRLRFQVHDATTSPWMPCPSVLKAFAGAHGECLEELEITFYGRTRSTAFPVMSFAIHMSSLRILTVQSVWSDAIDEQCLARCFSSPSPTPATAGPAAVVAPSPSEVGMSCVAELRLWGMAHLDNALLERILRAMPALQQLDLRDCHSVTDEGLKLIASLGRRVQTLKTHGMRGITAGGLESFAIARPDCQLQ